MKRYLFLTIITLFIGSVSVEAQAYKDFAGQWGFNCADAPEEFSTGDLFVSKKEGTIDVKIVYKNGVIAKGESTKIKDGKLEYIMKIEDGESINISLKLVDYKIKGTVTLASGEVLEVTASRTAH